MKKLILYGLILFSFIFNIVFIVHLIGMKSSERDNISLFGKDVKLTKAQENAINSRCSPYRKENSEFEKTLAVKRAKLLTLVNSESINMNRLESCINEINGIQKKIQMNVVKQLIIYKEHMNKEQCSCLMNNIGVEMDVDHLCDENCECSSQ